MAQPTSLLELNKAELTARLAAWNAPRYRADQVWEWLYKKLAAAPAEMTSLPAELRDRLTAELPATPLTQAVEQRSRDGQTVKWLFRLPDGLSIETVLMRYDERNTVCISTQAGCAMGCVFCATGQAGLARNLTAGEIVAQALAAARWLAQHEIRTTQSADDAVSPAQLGHSDTAPRLTNIVLMGMGEPFANYDRTWAALRTLTDPGAFGLGARHITVSTVGLPQGIRKMADEPLQVNLAVSLHAANDVLRTQLVPINHRYPIAEVLAAIKEYLTRTKRRVTFEYALMKGINDTPAHARELGARLKGLLCHVNLIPLNPVAESPYQPSTAENATTFQQILDARGIAATVRMRRGIDIDAGCGQLRRRMNG
jgi:23S rRNA (adenine2503-C2)-methyltransferase